MKSSTYAVLIGAYLLLMGSLLLIWPEDIINVMRALTDQHNLLLVGVRLS